MKSSCCVSAWVLTACVLLVCCPLVWAQGGWQPVGTPLGVELRDVDFTNALCGTVVGENSTIRRTADGGQTWTPQTGPPEEWFMSVSFATDSVGLIGGTGGTILFTQNAGAAWTTVQTGWMVSYQGAHQFSPTMGIVAGVNSIFAPLVAYSANAWQNFTPATFYLMDPGQVSNEGTLYDVQMLSASIGVAAAHVWDGHGAMVRTQNGGTTWNTVYWGTASLRAVDFPNPTVGYAVGASGLQVKSIDGGLSWTPLPNPLRLHWWDVDFVNADTGWVVGENAAIYRTNDGGLTWHSQHGGAGYLYGLDMVNADTGYAVGEGGVILKTTTGGDSVNLPPTPFVRLLPADSSVDPWLAPPLIRFVWSSTTDPEGEDLYYVLHVVADTTYPFDHIEETNDTTLDVTIDVPVNDADVISFFWTVNATNGDDFWGAANGTGIFFLNISDAPEFPPAVVEKLELTNYPNPFNAATVISFSLPTASDARLRVFDLTGREVFHRNLGDMAAGTHRVSLDASTLSSGVYVARLETARAAVSRKMVLLR